MEYFSGSAIAIFLSICPNINVPLHIYPDIAESYYSNSKEIVNFYWFGLSILFLQAHGIPLPHAIITTVKIARSFN
jgi:hypothetical protein